ncbi:uncharacterized protein MAM_07035 [Metarhizium album ARSEF 1941]|uniref:Uncharacterized protein n=1 Tax=Metarhizium album (strain ARSEF 1941) TaxID=1081103 RepID=A0A0B2WQ75_METAS|nr:uncharacterized protein MAM_07035 [Metarhizium album ARSEF 1941]KHN95150.1 hypothetical protein MAM_07035 [Metarhizium album ARSEF 1941]
MAGGVLSRQAKEKMDAIGVWYSGQASPEMKHMDGTVDRLGQAAGQMTAFV